ncbi:MAG: LysM peptidoglycan-binding domain-containing protein [Anaerolineae bacterium]
MLIRRTLPLIAIMLIVAGCFRQAEDNFDTVGSQNSGEITITDDDPLVEPTNITIIDPEATEALSAQADDETPTPRVIVVTEEVDDAETQAEDEQAAPTTTPLSIPTATVPVASNTPMPTEDAEPVFITPDFNEEAVQPTATLTPIVTRDPLQATPTAPGDTEIVAGECDYVVQGGDNLFRIALNNDVVLADLLAENGLTQASVIQPGQVLRLPNCAGGASTVPEEDTEAIPEEDEIRVLDSCEYVIQQNDTLFAIATENDITLASLLAENGLTQNSVIQPGQVIRFPDCVDSSAIEDGATVPDTTTTDTTAPEDTEEETLTQRTHTVVQGDTLLTIARQYGVTANGIIQANTIPNPNNLTPGQQLVIPD